MRKNLNRNKYKNINKRNAPRKKKPTGFMRQASNKAMELFREFFTATNEQKVVHGYTAYDRRTKKIRFYRSFEVIKLAS